MNAKMTASSLDEAEIQNLLETKDSTNDAEIQSLLDDWIRARRRVWDAFFGLVNANAQQMVESVLQAQAGALTTALRAFGPANSMNQLVAAWGEGMRRITETAAETQRKSGEVWSNALAEQSLTITEKKAQAPSKAG
jgi:hypothetical protein